MRFGDQTLRFISTIATLGSPHTLPCKNCESRLFTLLMKRLRTSPDPLRRASSFSVWLMKSIGVILSSARQEVEALVTIPTGVAWTLGVGGENSR
jgi:hypothetical protein